MKAVYHLGCTYVNTSKFKDRIIYNYICISMIVLESGCVMLAEEHERSHSYGATA